jgi:hypothetical protein
MQAIYGPYHGTESSGSFRSRWLALDACLPDCLSSTRSETWSKSSNGREILDFLEDAADRAEEAGDVLEGIDIKHG